MLDTTNNLKQGKEFLDLEKNKERNIIKNSKLFVKEKLANDIPNKEIYHEYFTNRKDDKKLAHLEDEFNKTMSDYSNTYTTYSQELMYDNNQHTINDLNKKLHKKNKKLINLANRILKDIDNKHKHSNKNNKEIEDYKKTFQKHISVLHKNNNEFIVMTNKTSTYDGLKETSKQVYTSNYIQNIIWLIVTITIILITLRAFLSNNVSEYTMLILLIVALILVYNFSKYIYRKFF